MTKYKNAYTEVYEIIKQLDEEEYNKIPSEVIKAIEENRNTEYEFECLRVDVAEYYENEEKLPTEITKEDYRKIREILDNISY